MRKLFLTLLSISLLFGVVIVPAQAQGSVTASVTIYNVDASNFPSVTGFVDVTDANGIFASGLKPEAVTLIENGHDLGLLFHALILLAHVLGGEGSSRFGGRSSEPKPR